MATQQPVEVDHGEVMRLLDAAEWGRIQILIRKDEKDWIGWRSIAHAISHGLVQPMRGGTLEVTPAGEEYRTQQLIKKLPTGTFKEFRLVLANGDRVSCSSFDEEEDILRWYESQGNKWEAYELLIETPEGPIAHTVCSGEQWWPGQGWPGMMLYRGKCRRCKQVNWLSCPREAVNFFKHCACCY